MTTKVILTIVDDEGDGFSETYQDWTGNLPRVGDLIQCYKKLHDGCVYMGTVTCVHHRIEYTRQNTKGKETKQHTTVHVKYIDGVDYLQCPHDTRSRPAPSPDALDIPLIIKCLESLTSEDECEMTAHQCRQITGYSDVYPCDNCEYPPKIINEIILLRQQHKEQQK